MDEWSSAGSRDVHDTLAEMDRRLSELQRDLAGVTSRPDAPPPPAPPPPPPPPADHEELRGVEDRLTRIAEEARLQADALAKRIDELTGLREELERSASQLADAAERARGAQRLPGPPEPESELEFEPVAEPEPESEPEPEPLEEELPPPTTTGASFTTEPSPPAWLASERSVPLEPATPPLPEVDEGEEPPAIDEAAFASVVDDGVDEKGPTVAEPEPEVEPDAPGRTVSLDAGPFADIVALSAFEEMLDRLPSVTQVYVRGLEGNRAHIDVRTTSEESIVDELRDGVPLAFGVTRDEPDHVTLTVEGIAPN
jgi:hypothetical protein